MMPILTPWYPEHLPARIQMLNNLKNDALVWGSQLPTLDLLSYPATLRAIVGEIAAAKSIGFDLAIPPYLASLAGANHGYYAVRTNDGTLHPLSFLFAVGADSGAGKSRAVEEELAVLEEWQTLKAEEAKAENDKISFANELAEEQYKQLKKQFIRSGDEEIFRELKEARSAIRQLKPLPQLLLNDVTSAAFSIAMSENGYVCRLESDGVMLPPDAYRQVTKYWAGESHRQSRVTRKDSFAKSPVMVDLLMTQTEFFREYVCDRKAIAAGLMARTLCYLYRLPENSPTFHVTRQVDQTVVALLKRKLIALLEASDSAKETAVIVLSPEAERLHNQASNFWRQEALPGRTLDKIEDFAVRMGQHAIRLAGLLWLSEHEVGCELPIDEQLMQCAISMTEVFAQHMMRARVVSFEDVNRACMKAAYEYILKGNFDRFPEKVVIEKLRHKFRAEEVRIALYTLVRFGAIKEVAAPMFGSRRKGRPSLGREYINVLFEPNGMVFD